MSTPPLTNNPDTAEQRSLWQSRLRKGWPILLLSGACVWIFAILATLSIPGDPKNSLLFGFSAARLGSIAAFLVVALLEAGLAWQSRRKPTWRERYLDPLVLRPVLFRIIMVLLMTLFTLVWMSSLLFTSQARDVGLGQSDFHTQYLAYYDRILPFLITIGIEMLIHIFGLFVLRHGVNSSSISTARLREERGLWLGTIGIYTSFLVVWVFMAVTGVGITEDVAGWGQPGVPVLFYQVFLVWLAGMALLWLSYYLRYKSSEYHRSSDTQPTTGDRENLQSGDKGLERFRQVIHTSTIDILIILAIWGLTFWVWYREPLQRSYFTLPAGPPNFETYPYSDAAIYDSIAQSIQVGNGFLDGQVAPRPIYALLLAILHAITGQKYDDVIFLQVIILAFFPVFLYLIGRELHSRPTGLILAGLAIIREASTIMSTQDADVSHSKLIMSDMPTALAVAVLTWLVIRWLKQPFARRLEALLAGGLLGITILIRTQAAVLLPFIALAVLLGYYRYWKKLVVPGLLFCLGLALTVAPWLVRNHAYTGSWTMDDPTYAGYMYIRYVIDLGEEATRQLPDESQAEYAIRMTAAARQIIQTRPDLVARFMTAHFLNNIVSTVLVLPTHFSLTDGCNTLVLCSAFWISSIENFSMANALLVAVNLFLISFGIASTWRRWRIIGLLPLFIFLGYNISNILLRNSGRRYILPVDWVGYLYFIIGLVDLVLWGSRLFSGNPERIQGLAPSREKTGALRKPDKKADRSLIPVGIFLLLIGLSLPLAETIVPQRYTLTSTAQLRQRLMELPEVHQTPFTQAALEEFIAQNAVIKIGRALYPRYYAEGKGESGSGQPAYKPYEYRPTKKLGFILVGPGGATQVNLALDAVPEVFANASDVILVGCQEEGYVDALLVAFLDGTGKVIIRSGPGKLTCPLR